MAKDFGSGYCIHCRKFDDELTADHIFPESWYPDATPTDLEKWRAPACRACNNENGKIERRVFQRLALGTDPWVPGATGIGERAFRSLDPRVAKNDKNRKHREAARDKLAREFTRVTNLPAANAVLPNVGTIQPPSGEGYFVTEVDVLDLGRVIKKIVLGVSYLRTGQVLPSEYAATVFSPSANSKISDDWLRTSCDRFERPPGFLVDRHYVPDDQFVAFYHLFLWERYEFFAAVTKAVQERSGG